MPPRVSVLMTTWNGAASIGASIESILRQSYRDFELVVVDDGSTDRTPAILAAIDDPRIRLLRPERNLGIVGARNFGFAACRGEFLAALDHDDLAYPERLARQVAYFDSHPEVVMLGTGAEIDTAGQRRLTDHPSGLTPPLLRWTLLVDNVFAWSSMMFRRAALERLGQFLRPEAEYADDFDLYHRLLALGEAGRLDEVLLTYRWHATNTTHAQSGVLFQRAVAVLEAAYRPFLGEDAAQAAELAVRHLSHRRPARDAASLAALGSLLARLLAGFSASLPAETRAAVAMDAGRLWWRVVRAAVRSGYPGLLRLHGGQPSLRQNFRPSVNDLCQSCAVGVVRAVMRR